ncbi:exonuclease domain-containing protein [Corynebacterium camporealensis]|uniref:exonuclease domain-containing protein n=1 Tax=Corynebacterium camporealensis TaxID=161896 RepID=UPI0034CD99F0
MFFSKKLVIDQPAKNTPVADVPFLAVDFETTGTDPRRDHIVSMGWIPLQGSEIHLGGAGYHVIKGAAVGESALIHGLTDTDVASGVSLEEGLDELLAALDGRILLAHFAGLELGFLRKAVDEVHNKKLQLRAVDTFALERRHMERMGTYPRGEDLRLQRACERYGLPKHGAHNAAGDALACAELFLAQQTRTKARTLADLLT